MPLDVDHTAALILRDLVADVPWVDLDLAGPARVEPTRGCPEGATGTASRTLLRVLVASA